MSAGATIVKRQRSEAYDKRKLYASIHASCLAVSAPIGAAEITAEKVVHHVEKWLAEKQEVTSADIRRIASKHLNFYHPEAAYMYAYSRLML